MIIVKKTNKWGLNQINDLHLNLKALKAINEATDHKNRKGEKHNTFFALNGMYNLLKNDLDGEIKFLGYVHVIAGDFEHSYRTVLLNDNEALKIDIWDTTKFEIITEFLLTKEENNL